MILSFKKRDSLILVHLLFLLFLGVLLTALLLKSNCQEFISNEDNDKANFSTQTNKVSPDKKPDGFARINLPLDIKDNYQIYMIADSGNQRAQHILYFPKDQAVIVPSMLSDYTFFSFHHSHWSFQYYSLGKTPLTEKVYGKPDKSQTTKLILSYYKDENGYWALAQPRDEYFKEYTMVTGMIIHAPTKTELDQYIELVDQYLEVEEHQYITHSSETEVPQRKLVNPNYTEPTGKYKFYLPPGFSLQERDEKRPDKPIVLATRAGQKICLSLKGGYSADVCGFSTSGCTCCNTGCYLVDIAFFSDKNGNLSLSGVLDKGGGEGWIRFLYGDGGLVHPWIYYSASYSSGMTDTPVEVNYQNYKNGVLNFLYLVESIDRTY